MDPERCDDCGECSKGLDEEASVVERTDEDGSKWRKVYFGSGDHFRNWLAQVIEVHGRQNVRVEDAETRLPCFGDERPKRIWVREKQ